ncbi:unnamed protein product [Schistosoma mattheei]|uniref:Uncharacterized protein n=1 Tax=Schistosoma mattheei TaxID=31246 RepID=A0A183PQV5_9TREM|nr:unnamed protein product [Schistosoma mattheei]
MVYLRKSLASYGIHTMDYSAKSACRTANRCIQSEDQGQTRLPTLLFSPMIDWIVKTSTFEGMHGIRWTAYMQLDDLDTRDNLALLSHTHEQIQVKTTRITEDSGSTSTCQPGGISKNTLLRERK